jgi:hypothetical protein
VTIGASSASARAAYMASYAVTFWRPSEETEMGVTVAIKVAKIGNRFGRAVS